MNRIVENKLTFDYTSSIIKISTQRMDQESNVSFFFFPGWITRNQVKNILLPGNLVLFGNEFRKRINKETSKIFFSFKKKNETKRTSRIKSGRFRLIFSRRRMEWRLTPGTRLSRENPHAASISWIFPISNLGFSREKPTNQVRFFFFFLQEQTIKK